MIKINFSRISKIFEKISPEVIVFLISLYLLVSQIYFGETLRSAFFYIGSFGLSLLALIVTIWQTRYSLPLLLLFLFSCIFWAFAYIPAINGSDDNMAYLIYAKSFVNHYKDTIQPLSERRMFSVGGLYSLALLGLRG